MIKSNEIDSSSIVAQRDIITIRAFIVAIEVSRNIRFRHQKDLLYYINDNDDNHERLCIFEFMKFEIFKQIHNYMYYDDFYRTYN